MGAEGGESLSQIDVRRITKADLHRVDHQIMDLSYNALDATEGRDLEVREHDVTHLDKQYLAPGKHGEIFVAMKGDRVVGFVALKKIPGTPKTAQIEQIRMRSSQKGDHVLAELLRGVAAQLEAEEHISKTKISVEAGAPLQIGSIRELDWFRHSFSITETEKEDDKHEAHG